MSDPETTDALVECHRRLARLLGPDAEPIEVLRCAEEHRAYWRPDHVRVILLAESHVYTTISELDRRVILPRSMGTDIPRGFVRLVYCLGYGENNLLSQPIQQNTGTPQFWKIFYSCVNQVSRNEDFAPIQSSRTPYPERIWNKLSLLERLKEMGVWLLDASVAALYPKPNSKMVYAAIRTSWDSYVGPIVKAADPSHIICIGTGVKNTLADRLSDLGVPVTSVRQPNARLSTAEHFAGFQKYFEVVHRELP
jgi:hypothetical protein